MVQKTREFITNNFEAIPSVMVERAYELHEDIENITPAVFNEGDYILNAYSGEEAIIIKVNEDTVIVKIEDEEQEQEWNLSDIDTSEIETDWCMWGWMWLADCFMSKFILENLEDVARCGFQIYEEFENGYVLLGIDGAGYDFTARHFTPLMELYKN